MPDGLGGMDAKDLPWHWIGCGCLVFVLLAGVMLGISIALAVK